MTPNEPVAIVCSGSGMRSAHGGGFLYALATELGITAPDIMIGSSGNAGNVLYFSTGQYESGKRIWTEHLATPRFISPLRFWKILDVDYLIDTVLKKQEPLDVARLKSTLIRWFISIEDFDTGHTRYVGAADNVDIFEVLRATAAMPIVYGKKIKIGGERYADGEFGPTLQDHITYALRQGAKRILVINDTAPPGVISRAILESYAAHLPHDMHDAIIRDISTNVFQMSAPGAQIIAVAPQRLPAGRLTRDKRKLRATFERGVADALAIKEELRGFFEK